MNVEFNYLVLPVIGIPKPIFHSFVNAYINKAYDKIIVECTKKENIIFDIPHCLDYFYNDNNIFYIFSNTEPKIVKYLLEGKYKYVLYHYPEYIELINITCGLVYTPKQQAILLAKLNRTSVAKALLEKEFEAFDTVLTEEDEYLPPLLDDDTIFIETRLKDTYKDVLTKKLEKLRKRRLYEKTSL